MSLPQRASRAEALEATSPSPQAGYWPTGVSRAGTMTIGAVLAILRAEFPAVSVSKLRFLEDQGLVSPTRTGAGYRKYSQADIERLRYTLTQQRDHYLPLKVIREQLEELDAGGEPEVPSHARVVASDGEIVMPVHGARVTARELAELTGASAATVEDVAASGLIVPDGRGRYAPQSVAVIQLVARLSHHGITARHLRSMRSNAEHVAGLVDQVVSPGRSQHAAIARERSLAEAAEIGETAADLYSELLRIAIAAESG